MTSYIAKIINTILTIINNILTLFIIFFTIISNTSGVGVLELANKLTQSMSKSIRL